MNVKIFASDVDPKALEQVDTLMRQPTFSKQKVRIMPDVHVGIGCVIGFTSTLGDYIIPYIVGVDIGCGVMAVNIGNATPDVQRLDTVIRTNIPSGRDVHQHKQANTGDMEKLLCYDALRNVHRLERSMGTLGGGNHFIEVNQSGGGDYYLVVHTGSRNLGKQVAEHYQNLAVQRLKSQKAGRVPRGLEYLTGSDSKAYLHDMHLVQKWAHQNRETILSVLLDKMSWQVQGCIESVHNYIDDGIIRKGAVSARKGERVIIPINMRDGTILATGKGNPDWNCSAPHGAGRIMSRKQAFRDLNMKDYAASMRGIYTTSVSKGTLDEAPMAYKPMREILGAIQDTVTIDEVITPVYNYKAADGRE